MNKWEKLGLIFDPINRNKWMYSHCQSPVAEHIENDIFKIYFATRNSDKISQIGSITVDIKKPNNVLDISEKPVLYHGNFGNFDEHGVYPSCIINIGEKKYMYYVGYVRGFESPMFYASIGLAVSNDGGNYFHKISNSPILSRSIHDPCLVTSPCVKKINGEFKMTYVSGVEWFRNINNQLQSKYHIKTAYSKNGIDWIRNGDIAIDFKNKDETNIARPSIISVGKKYHMWFCYAGKNFDYRIGYSVSNDFVNWKRQDNLSGIKLSKDGFDNKMACYPFVFKHEDDLYMLYNGNGYGKMGIGLSKCKNFK